MTTPTTVQARFQLRADTAANWASVNPTLLNNEFGLETDTKKLKVGNGSTAWNSLAYFPSIVTGGTVLGNLEIGTTGTLTFEGSTADGFETTLGVVNPTADRTINLPNQSGTVIVSGNASIVNADISATAEIAVSKLADGAARQVLQTDSAGTGVEWTDSLDLPGTLDVTQAATFDSSVTIQGDLTVNGTTTTIDTQNLTVEDKNVIIGNVTSPSDVTADGGGITLKGTTDKTISWSDTTNAWTSSEVVDIPAGTESAPSLIFGGDVNSGLYSPGADQVAISTAGTGRMFINANGRLLVGTSSSITTVDHVANSGAPLLQVGGTTVLLSSVLLNSWGTAAASASNLQFAKSKSGTVGTRGVVASGDNLGALVFEGDDGTNFIRAALIRADVDGAPATDDMPGRLVFSTTPSGSATPTERLRIDSAGTTTLTSAASTAPFIAKISASEVARIDSSGRLLVGTSTGAATGGTAIPTIQVVGTSAVPRIGAFGLNGTPWLVLARTTSTSLGTYSAVGAANIVGRVIFAGDDGTNYESIGAEVTATAEATWSTGSAPTRLGLFTTPSGAASSTERLRITSSGKIGLGTTAPAATAHISGNTIVSKVDLANASYDSVSFSVATEETTPNGLFFSPDGRKMFVNGAGGDDVNEYTLSTPWVVSSATYATVFSTSAQDTSPQGIFFRSDGLKMYVLGTTNDSVYQYALTTPWSVATASYESKSFSVATQETGPTGIFFKPNGLAMYVVGTVSDAVQQYTLSTAWDVSTATFAQSFSIASQETATNDLSFTHDGTNMFVLGSTGDDVTIYTLTTPWDISTAAHVTQFSVSTQDAAPGGLYVKPDGTKFYMVGQTNDTVYQYTIPSAEIDLTGTTNINGDATIAQDLTVRGGIAGSEIKLLTTGADLTRTERLRITNTGTIFCGNGETAASPTSSTISATGGSGTDIGGATLTIQGGRGTGTGAGGPIVFNTAAAGSTGTTLNAASERMRITSDGKVGVGTSSPSQMLHVTRAASVGGSRAATASGDTGESTSIQAVSVTSTFQQFNLTGGSLTLAAGAVNTNRVGNGEGRTYTGGDVNILAGNAQYSGTTGNTINRGQIIFGRRSVDTSNVFTDTELARIDSSGRLLVGTSTAASTQDGNLQVITAACIRRNINSTGAGALRLEKTRSSSDGTYTAVSSGDALGDVQYYGADGTQLVQAASIKAEVDGTPGTSDMPGRLVLSTTADGASSPTEALRITNDRVIAYNQGAPVAVNSTGTLTVANLKTGIITSTSAAATDMTLPTGTNTESGFSGVYTNMTFEWSVINTGPSLVRVLVGTDHTIVGSGSVATGTSGRFASRRTAANTFVTYRLV